MAPSLRGKGGGGGGSGSGNGNGSGNDSGSGSGGGGGNGPGCTSTWLGEPVAWLWALLPGAAHSLLQLAAVLGAHTHLYSARGPVLVLALLACLAAAQAAVRAFFFVFP
jgi:hypothetical protein